MSQDEIPLRVYDDYEYNTFYNVPKEELYITKYVDFPSLRRNADISDEEFKKRKLEFQDTIKTHIMNYGSIFAAIYATDNPNHYIGEKSNDKNKLLDHTISIVGWDDNYSKENFKTPEGYIPEEDGAYIVLNSWGADWGYDGYFYISYEDQNVESGMSGIASTSFKEAYEIDKITNSVFKDIVLQRLSNTFKEMTGMLFVLFPRTSSCRSSIRPPH